MRRLLVVAIATTACRGSGSGESDFAAYESPGWCFDTSIQLDKGDGDVEKGMTSVAIELDGSGYKFAVPDETARTLVPLETYRLCAAPLHLRKKAPPTPLIVELWKGPTLVWSESYEFAVSQKLAWAADRHELVVELGRAMDEMWAVPFHGVGPVRVSVPDELRHMSVDDDRDYRVVVRLDLHQAGAQLSLVELDADAGEVVWKTMRPRTTRLPSAGE
jgi:hypothetical protein